MSKNAKITSLIVTAKCSDLFTATILGEYGPVNFTGYPLFIGRGDYIQLEVDGGTGQIKNWDKIVDEIRAYYEEEVGKGFLDSV